MIHFNLAGLQGYLLGAALAVVAFVGLDAFGILPYPAADSGQFLPYAFKFMCMMSFAAASFGALYDRLPRGKRTALYWNPGILHQLHEAENSRARIAYFGGPLVGHAYLWPIYYLLAAGLDPGWRTLDLAAWSGAAAAAGIMLGTLTIPLRTLPEEAQVTGTADSGNSQGRANG